MEEKKGLSMPIAIIIAAVLVAGAIFGGFAYWKKSPATPAVPGQQPVVTPQGITGSDYILGNAKADVVIITYTDLECPFCKVFDKTLQQINQKYGDKVGLVYRMSPIAQLHPKSRAEATAWICAGQLGGNAKFWQYAEAVFAATPSNNGLDLTLLPKFATEIGLDATKFAACTAGTDAAKLVDQETADAAKYGGQGTPFPLVFYKGKFLGALPGAVPFADYKDQQGQTQPGLGTIIDGLLAGKVPTQ
jgi:protein-disulfide isomerase